MASLPAPPSAPNPPSAAEAVEILAAPPSSELAASTSSGSSGDLAIRYDASLGQYEVRVDDGAWQALRQSSTYNSTPEHYFSFGSASDPSFFQVVATAKDSAPGNYRYSSLAAWGKGAGAYWDDSNFTAFGVPTSTASMPVVGSASYSGLIAGDSDVLKQDYLVGGVVAATVYGTVDLQFDFAAGSLAGAIHPTLSTFEGNLDLGSIAFANTVYSSGNTSFSGSFETPLTGANSFDGQFTGPAAEELIGRWSFPFLYPADGATHTASGAWIAKR